jgi:uncharacterized protein (DUF302 family)
MFDDRYTFGARLATAPSSFADVREVVVDALKTEGFGVLSEIDVAATLKAKIGVERDPYLILGACNPPLAHRSLTADPSIGALLPCNVVVRVEGAGVVVEAMNPDAALGLVGLAEVAAVAAEAGARLRRVVAAVEARYATAPA